MTTSSPAPTPSAFHASSTSSRRVALLVLALLTSLSLALVGGAQVAEAAPKGAVAVFGSSGSGAGEFSFAAGVAVNQDTGDVYVVDVFNERVQQFDADGGFIRAWGGNVVDNADPGTPPPDPAVHQVCTTTCAAGTPGSGEGVFSFGGNAAAGIAVDPSDGSVYVADTANNRIQKFTAAGVFVAEFGTAGGGDGELSAPSGVAVHPTSGDVLVADTGNSRVQRFSASGVYEAQFATSAPQGVAVDSTGAVYVVEQFAASPRKYSADGTEQPFAYSNLNPVYGIAVDPATDHVFAAQSFLDPETEIFNGSEVIELDSAGTIVEHHRYRPDSGSADAYGLAIRSSTGRIHVSQTFEDRVFILDTPPQTATVEPPTDIGARSATLNGTINTGGGLPVFYHFEVSADNGQTWTSFPAADAGPVSDPGDNPVAEVATGLEPGRDYLVRLVATNEFDATVTSDSIPFTTLPAPPDARTLDATQLLPTGATLAGEINPNNAQTTYRFEWGNSTDYGNTIPIPDASAGNGGTPVIVTQQLDGLLPNTVYHYRIVATNSQGTTTGADRTFQTTPDTTVEPRAYELVTPAYKIGGQGIGAWSSRPDGAGVWGFAAHDGERFMVAGGNGNVLVDSAFGYRDDWALGQRTPTGWTHQPAVSRPAHAPQPTTDFLLDAATPDLSVMAWKSAQVLKLFPEMADWNDDIDPLLLRRWTEPQFEVFGPTDPAQDVPAGGGPAFNSPLRDFPTSFAVDGSAFVTSAPGVRGLAGAGDPTHPMSDDRDAAAGSVYLDEITGPFSDVFPGDDGARELVNVCTGTGADRTVLPSGPCPDPLPGRRWRLTSQGGAALFFQFDLNFNASMPRSVVSADGSRVFFMSPDPNLDVASYGPAQLFVRQRGVDGQVVTRWISRSEVAGQDDSLRAPAFFEGASRDGDKVFFRTTSPLTDDDPNGGQSITSGTPDPRSSDLFMYDLPDGPDGDPATPDADPDGGELTRISAGPDADADCNVQFGTARFVSDDASRVYFTCAAPLTGSVPAADGTITGAAGDTASDDASNLYLHDGNRPVGDRWSFVARLPRESVAGGCATSAISIGYILAPANASLEFSVDGSQNCVRGTRDGSLVTFFADGRLTADDPDAVSGDVYGYDADAHRLTRLSADQGGAGGDYLCDSSSGMRCHGDGGIGVGLGSGSPVEALGVAERPNGDRLALFESSSRLLAEDTDVTSDIYQWRDGQLKLLTPEHSANGAYFFGNDRAGQNVYFRTRDRLTWQDKDKVLDVYTARIDGGISEPPPAPVCPVLADGCQGAAPVAPVVPQIGSNGPGSRGNANPGVRKKLTLGRLSAKQRRRAARTGKIRLRVRTNAAGKITLTARAKLAGRTRLIGRASKRATKPGVVTISLRLSPRARTALSRGRKLRITFRASQAGAKPRATTANLRRSDK